MLIYIVVGARPNFMKIAPIIAEIKKHPTISYKLIHTGQHFDKNMSDAFFEDLGLPYPDINLNIHGGSVAEQIGKVLIACNTLFQEEKPDYLLVVGDVNATVAGAIAAKQNGIRVIHVEAGLRSFDRTMPEEINRILTDSIADLLFVTEESAVVNLRSEGIVEGVHTVGNVMIDCLITNLSKISASIILDTLSLNPKNYAVITFHRPSNVDTKDSLEKFLIFFKQLSEQIHLVLPLHPRTKGNIEKYNLGHYLSNDKIILTEPLGYLDFMQLVKHSLLVLTDSGGVQEETTYLQIPCVTMRKSTERPVTCDLGTNTLVGDDFEMIHDCLDAIVRGTYKTGSIPHTWDGNTAGRIIAEILNDYAHIGK